MDKLWAPWRQKYVTKIASHPKGCVFCAMEKEKKDKKNYIFARTKHCFAVLNIYPYNNGHVLILPKRHVRDLSRLKKEEKLELYELMESTQKILEKVMQAHGFNIGINIGKYAGAGFPGHLHIHIVPRWRGDVNFMPVVGNTKVISQSLETLHKLLTDAQPSRI